MKRLGTTQPDADPALQRLIVEARARQSRGLLDRERAVELLAAAGFIAIAVPMAALIDPGRSLNAPLAVGLVVAFALSARVEFYTGSGWTVPTQLIFVPMLFLLPTPAVPLFVAAALLVAKLPEYVSGEVRFDRAALGVGDAWYAVGPALVLGLAGAVSPAWGDWPIYLGALCAQLGFEIVTSTIRGTLGLGLRLRKHLEELRAVCLVDALLSPIGLLTAFAAAGQHWAFLLVMPLVGLIAIFAHEREARIENALTLSQAYRGTAHLLEELLSASNAYTGFHSRSVVDLCHHVGAAMGLDEKTLRDVEFAALLHDIGKMTVPNEILDKPGKLTEEEWEVIRKHTLEGERMLARIGGVLAEVGHIVRSHHEHYDGRGYPDGLRGEQIPVAARVIACCDAFNAMTTDRPYRPAMTMAEALAELTDNSGTQFDPDVVEVIASIVQNWELTARARANGSGIGAAKVEPAPALAGG